ncbi:MAG: response regulator [Eubacterium sp.]|nr:response regulator [Eubacterium sp.]
MSTNESKKGITKIIIVVTVYLAIILGLAFFSMTRSHRIMDELLKKEMIEVARSASTLIDGDSLIGLTEESVDTPAYKEIYDTLSIFMKKTEAKYVYAVRCVPGGRYTFLVDTDPEDPGRFGEPVVGTEAMDAATDGIPDVDDRAYEDRWGSFYSAYCPVYASSGELAGLICADFPADWYEGEVGTQFRLILILGASAIFFCGLIIILILRNAKREAAEKAKEKEELELAKSMAEEANFRRNEFLDMISHEIRTPINMVMGMDEMILRESVEPEVREDAVEIRHAGNHLLMLVDEMLDMSKIDSKSTTLDPVRYDPFLLISDLTEMVRGRMRNSEVQFFTEIDDKLPSILFGDTTRLKQCLINLLNNSVRYTKTGEIHFNVSRERIRDNYVWLKFSVRDTGEGVPKDALKRMTEVFSGGEIPNDEISSGITELGLTMANRQLRMMGSILEFESELGVGSTFYFKLKQKVIDEKPIGDYRKAREVMAYEEDNIEHENYTAPEAKILVVDDERMNLAVVKSLLQSTQIEVDTTQSGAEALEMMAEKTYDVLMFDHLMREIDGIELLRLVRENRDNPNCVIPCIVLTANVAEGAKEGYLKVGFDAYLPKPLNKDRLEGVLLRYLPRNKVKIEPKFPGAK